ncbi:YolD-like family protein [Brevibacillus borstelensis]|uniref:YolD-like family protein n=1 Tax=Brevibacillus borstelensis TaxID=45462 RepID=UPI0030F9B2F8
MGKVDDLFAMRWVLPEHNQALSDYYYEKTLVEKPELEEDEKVEINRLLQESLQLDYAVTVSWWKPVREDLGEIHASWGWLQRIDMPHRQIKLINDEEFWWINLDQIVKVEA